MLQYAGVYERLNAGWAAYDEVFKEQDKNS